MGVLQCSRKLQQFSIQLCAFLRIPSYLDGKKLFTIARTLAFQLP